MNNALMLSSDVEVEVTPLSPTNIHPGDSFDYKVTLSNTSAAPKNVTAMVYAKIPTGTEITLQGPIALNLDPGGILSGTFTASVPGSAPTGYYRILGRVWTSGFIDFDEDEEIYNVIP